MDTARAADSSVPSPPSTTTKFSATGGHLLPRENFHAGGKGRGLGIDHNLVLMLAKPGQQGRDDICQFRFARLGNDAGELVC